MGSDWTLKDAEKDLKERVLYELQARGNNEFTYIPSDLWNDSDVQFEVQRALKDLNNTEDDVVEIVDVIMSILWQNYVERAPVPAGQNMVVDRSANRRNPGRSVSMTPYAPTENEALAEAAVRGYIEQELSNVYDIVRFRRELNELMLPEQVWRFMASPVNQLMTFQEQRRHALTPLTAWGQVTSERVIHSTTATTLRESTIAIAGTNEEVTVVNDCAKIIALQSNALLGDAPFPGDTYIITPGHLSKFPDTFFSPFPGPARNYQCISGYLGDSSYTGTVAGEALRISREISARYDMEAKEALVFLLHGHLPQRNPIEARQSVLPLFNPQVERTNALQWDENRCPKWNENKGASYGPVTLRIRHYVSAQRIMDHIRTLQRASLGQDNSLEKVKNLDLFCFVNTATSNCRRHSGHRRGTVSWKELFGIWRQNPLQKLLQTPCSEDREVAVAEERRSEGFPSRFREAYSKVKEVLFPVIK